MSSLTVYVESAARGSKFTIAAGLSGVPLSVVVVAEGTASSVTAATPFGQLPVMTTPGGSVSRSGAILRYLAGVSEEIPLATAAVIDSWLDWSLASLEPAAALLSPAAAGLVDSAQLSHARAAALAKLPPALAALDAHLASKTFIADERVTIADVAITCALAPIWGAAGLDTAQWTHLTRWYLTCRHQAAFIKALGDVSMATAAATAPAGLPSASWTALDAVGAVGVNAIVPSITPTTIPNRFVRHRVRIVDLLGAGLETVGRTVVVCGWLKTSREGGAGSLIFAAVNDGSCFDSIQVVCERGKSTGFEALAACGGTGASVRFEGEVVKSPAKGQLVEVNASSIKVLGNVADPATYPLAKKKHTLEYMREIQHLRPRSNTISAVARVRNACAFATHTFFNERGFLYVHTPIVTAADCEGAGEMFSVTTLLPSNAKAEIPRTKDGAIDYSRDFFSRPTMLTVSGQLQVEAYACAMSDVYTFGPTFRAENSHTSRHLAEFWMIEPEISFATLSEDMALAEDYLKFCTQWVLDHCAEDLKFFEDTFEKGLRDRLRNVVAEPFKVLTYTEAIEMLSTPEHQAAGKFTEKVFWGCDLASEHERYITEKVRVQRRPLLAMVLRTHARA
jgi:asparaginyl-tRNA synthetase